MHCPLVSVIIPVFNVRLFLPEALESVVNQTYKNLEIILIDDGSIYESGEICDQYKKNDNRIRVIHQKNLGLSGTRNTGVNIIRGELISFLDPDDIFVPNTIECLVNGISFTEADISVCSYCSF